MMVEIRLSFDFTGNHKFFYFEDENNDTQSRVSNSNDRDDGHEKATKVTMMMRNFMFLKKHYDDDYQDDNTDGYDLDKYYYIDENDD